MNANWLYAAAGVHFAIAGLNLGLKRIMNWQDDLRRMPLIIREVMQIHGWFISITLAIFGVLTIRFAPDMALGSDIVLRWLAFSIATFWGVRTVLQVVGYSSSHWRGKVRETILHIVLLIVFTTVTTVYLAAGLTGV
ncbi:MAG: hypothetical protein O2923_06930 [Verrucomicrobia bacterium]|nr:hypothetical protein [Verrucomicrobiota bacterium]MDA1087735.1 hypothetical protein [Verrucomicrobiota bacterium]